MLQRLLIRMIPVSVYVFLSIWFAPSIFAEEPPAKTSESNSDLVFWHMAYEDQDLLKSMSTAFSALTGYTIDARYIEINDLQLALIRSVRDGEAPDVVMIPSDKVGITDFKLSPVPPTWQNPNISAQNLNTVKVGGQHYGAPILGGNHIMMYYNRKYVDQPAKTWAELQAQIPSLEEKGVQAIGWNYQEMYWVVGFMGAFGGWPIEDGKITINSPQFKQGLKFYKSLSKDGVIDANCSYDCAADRFFNGEFAYALNGDWAYNDAKKHLGENLGVTTIPRVKDKVVTPMFSTIALAFPNHSIAKKTEALKSFMQFMQSGPVQKQWFQQVNRYPVDDKVIKDLKIDADENLKGYLQQLKEARAMPADASMTYAWIGMGKWFKQFIENKISADDAVKLMQLYAEKKMKEGEAK